MVSSQILLEEPIRMASIFEPSKATFFPAMTKVVGTLGPRSRSVDVLAGCLKAGMSVARFDFSLGGPEYHQETLENLRAAIKTTKKLCAGNSYIDTAGWIPKIRAFDCQGHVAKLCIVFLPLLFAALVALSRVDDYWHHWQEVFTGGILGLPSNLDG